MRVVGSRAERNRELLSNSAALLAADYPLDVLIERLCDAIAIAFQGTVYVALPADDGVIRIECLTRRGHRLEHRGDPMPEGSRVGRVFRTGQTIVMSEPDDWIGEPEYALHFADGSVDSKADAVSAMYVPIVHGAKVLGVLSVQHEQAGQFYRDDVQVVEAVARYLAIALQNQRARHLVSSPIRYPWYAAAIIVLVAIFATAVVGFTIRGRLSAMQTQTAASDEGRLHHVLGTLSEYVQSDAQFARIAAELIGPVRGDRALAERLLSGLVHAADHRYVLGAGVFYAPHVFDAKSNLFGPYAFMMGGPLTLRHNTEANYDYPKLGWYREGAEGYGRTVFTAPYVERGVTYISAVKGIYDGTRLVAVVSVDSRGAAIMNVLRASRIAGDRFAVKSGRTTVLASGPRLTGSARTSISAAIPLTPWALELSSDASASLAERRELLVDLAATIVAIWGVAAAMLAFLTTTYRARRYAARLKLQRTELQSEIATRIDAEEQLRAAAYHDALTGLPNRAFFFDQLRDILNRRAGEPGLQYAVLFLDLDRFYVVNDTLGHNAGDALLRSISHRMHDALPAHVLTARLGGDEFVLLLPSNGDVIADATATAELILDEFRRPFFLGDREAYTGASIGIVVIDETYANAESVLRDADISMYQAKRSGRSRYALFDRTLRSRMSEQLELEADLRGAVERREIVPYYQTIVSVHDGSVASFEALARWYRPGYGIVGAGDFIGVAEQSGLLHPIDAALLDRVCAEAGELLEAVPNARIGVNVSAADLTRANLIDDMEFALREHGLTPAALRVEITETAVMEDAELSLMVLERLRARGFSIVVDDFGVGHSSLSYLQRLPISGVKIDRSFIIPLGRNPQALEIMRTIVMLAKTLDLFTVAEGVETYEEFELLRSVGVDYAQGFFFSQPRSIGELKTHFSSPLTGRSAAASVVAEG